jgi:hypothetical protein
VTTPLDPGELLRRLHSARVEHVLIGGLAVNAHGVIRSTKDVDICPAPDPRNLARLGDDLAEGGNFRLETPLGVLDIMQWIPGIEADAAYPTLAADSQRPVAFGIEIRVCSLPALRQMKRAAGRPQDLQDLADLDLAHPDEPRS